MLLELYRGATGLGGPLIEAQLRRRVARGKEHPLRWRERLGAAGAARPDGPLLWLHAASVGESRSLLPLIEALLARRAALQVLVTTGTVTSAALLREQLPGRARHQFAPVDRPQAWRAFFTHWRPQLGVLVESELWPNLILEARARDLPLALINGRMSARSFRRWMRLPASAARLAGGFALCLAQSDADRARLAALGAPQVTIAGNLKYAAPPLPADPHALAALAGAIGGRPVWLAASTHAGEEALVLDAHRCLARHLPDLLTIIAPRDPRRGDDLAAEIRRRGFRVAQRSRSQPPGTACEVLLADTLGELGLLYRLARVALVGGSLVPHGGQNPLEPSRLGCPTLLGPHTQNFAEIAALLVDRGAALRIADGAGLLAALAALVPDREGLARMGAQSRAVADALEHAGSETLARLGPLLDRTLGPADAGA
ncbi:MAG TPA: 3-deoxy-D-manno-octulosonic acid transferase [Geminicoccaceae bacterium]|nr:3-deoxy-D-manno-octulosonic acid transferase [Geminicoccaceae bacterium]